MKQKPNVYQITSLALLFALSIVLMLLESMIPPLPALPPGVKLGLSNIAVMYCLFYMGKGSSFILLLLKSLFVFLTRGLIAFCMSFAGGLSSLFIMILLTSLKKYNLSLIIISVCAAVTHNMAQLLVSAVILSGAAVFYYAPVLAVSGILMGIVTGVLLRVMMPVMRRLDFGPRTPK